MNDDFYGLSSTYGSIQGDISIDWIDSKYDSCDYLSKQISTNMDRDVEKIKAMIDAPKQKITEEKVIDIVNGGFESHFGMTIQEFQETYDAILENNPEKLI